MAPHTAVMDTFRRGGGRALRKLKKKKKKIENGRTNSADNGRRLRDTLRERQTLIHELTNTYAKTFHAAND